MSNQDTVTILKSEYTQLRIAQEQLRRLEVGGVDNWEWYGESMNPEGEPDMDEEEESIKREVAKRTS